MTGRWTTAVLLGVCAGAAGVPDIRIIECRLVPERCRQGETLVLRVRATASGVACMNFRLRTPYRAAKGDCPDGFAIEPGSGCAVLADGPGGNLMDNGERDRDAAAGALEVPVPTAGLGPGVHYLVVFAHNRPGEGRHVLDWRNLKLTLAEGRVTAAVLDAEAAGAEEGVEFLLPPRRPGAGGGVVCGVRRRDGLSQPLSLRLATPYTCLPEETPPGFHYDAGTKSASLGDSPGQTIADNGPLDTDPASGTIRVRLDTGTWTSGIHALTLEAPAEQVRGPYRRTAPVYRDVQIAVPGPGDHLEVRVGDAVTVGKGTHFEALVSLGNGRVTTGSHSSEDGGRTWRPSPRPAMPRPNLLGDGSLLAVSYRALPVPGHAGVFTVDVYRSEDGGRTVAGPRRAEVRVPLARGALGHGLHVGPLFGRSLVELENGDLLAGMYGWFEGDTEPDRYREGGTMRRAYVCRSRDRGETWEYLSTIAYRPFLGNEGYSEVVLRRLPEGEILALIRTGGNSAPGWQDNPLVSSRSLDGGVTWTPVARTGVEGVWPDLCVMAGGLLVCSTGRPGAFVMFSADGGRTWTDHTPIDPERYSGYTAVCEIEPGRLLVGYGVRQGWDEQTQTRRDMLRVVPVTVQPGDMPR